ncbi:MAG: DUF4097 family beta strand repeat-containing protein [Terriglobia bacterium]
MGKTKLSLMVVGCATFLMFATTALGSGMFDVRGTFERTLKVTGPVDLEIATNSGDITVVSGNSNEVFIKGIIHVDQNVIFGGDDGEERIHTIQQNPPIQQDGNHIQIGPLRDQSLARHLSIDYQVTVPSRTQLTSKSGSGDLTVRGLMGPVNGTTGSGDLKLTDVRGDVHLKTGSGDGDFQDISGGQVVIESGSGDMQFRNIHAALHVRTSSGDVKAQGEPTGQWILSTGSGDVTLNLPDSGGFDLDASTDSGDIDTNLPITVQGRAGGKELTGQVRGGGHLIRLRTGSGDIRID